MDPVIEGWTCQTTFIIQLSSHSNRRTSRELVESLCPIPVGPIGRRKIEEQGAIVVEDT